MREERLPTGGAVLAAAAASLCCIGPLLFVLLGLGAFGAATAFDAARPYLLVAAALLLAFGFYRAYFRRGAATCSPGEACATKPANSAGRAALWIAAVAVLAFTLSPYYAGALARRVITKPATPEAAPATAARQPTVAKAAFKVSGMTCAGCETTIKLALDRTPGVRNSEVSYDRGEAVVEYDPAVTTPEKLREAISETGYPAEVKR